MNSLIVYAVLLIVAVCFIRWFFNWYFKSYNIAVIVSLQRRFRKFHFNRSVVLLQGVIVRSFARSDFIRHRSAAVVIQSMFRMYRLRKNFIRQRCAALRIQRFLRVRFFPARRFNMVVHMVCKVNKRCLFFMGWMFLRCVYFFLCLIVRFSVFVFFRTCGVIFRRCCRFKILRLRWVSGCILRCIVCVVRVVAKVSFRSVVLIAKCLL